MKRKKTSIFLICPSWVIRTGLSHIIGEESDLEVIDSAADLSCLGTRRLDSMNPDMIILDPSAGSAAGIGDLKSYYDQLDGHILVGALNAAYSQEIIDQFDTFFTINDSPSQIVKKIRKAHDAASTDVSAAENESQNMLSARESEVLAEVARGLSNKEIADKLSISVFTVTTHRKNISQKLGIHSIAGLTVYAVMNHLID